MGGPIGRKAIKKEQHDNSPPVAEFEGPHSHLVCRTNPIAMPCDHSVAGLFWTESTSSQLARLLNRCVFTSVVFVARRELVLVREC